MIEIHDQQIFGKVIAGALVRIDQNTKLQTWEKLRAVNALTKAITQIEESGAWMSLDDAGDLLIWSDRSNNIYEIGPDSKNCQCQAHLNGYICWHKAASRLIRLYLKAVADADQADFEAKAASGLSSFNNTPYLKQTNTKKAETFGGVRI